MSDRFEHTLEHTLGSKADEPGGAGQVRRIELITGSGRRRRWPSKEKARILLESLEPGANVSEVARRHGLSPQQLFGWRREARAFRRVRRPKPSGQPQANAPAFAPVVIAAATPTAPEVPPCPPGEATSTGLIEIAIGDAVVRLLGEVEMAVLARVLRAVRRAS